MIMPEEQQGRCWARLSLMVWICCTLHVYASTATSTTPTTIAPTTSTVLTTSPGTDALGDVPKAMITIVVLAVILGIAIVIAKLATMCYERGEIRDDASDISEHTRDLLKAKLTVAKFKSMLSKSRKVVDREKMRQDASRRYAKIWVANVRKKRKMRTEAVAAKWTAQTRERSSVVSLVPPIGTKPVDGSSPNSDPSKVAPPIEVKVINETEKPKPNPGKGADGKFVTRFPLALKKQAAIPAPHPDDPKSDILDTPKKTAGGTDPKQKTADNVAKDPPSAVQREQSVGGAVTPKNVAVEVDNKPITAKSQAMRPVSAKPKLIRPSSADKKHARPGTAKRPTTAKRKPEASATTNRPTTAAKRPTTAKQKAHQNKGS